MVAGIVEHQFAQKLAANDKSARDKAVRKLKKWLNARSTCTQNVITKEELLYLWKGLFYCMWMSDKPLIQEELADVLSDLNTCFVNSDYALIFIDAFFETMHREWSGIDYLRIDKFMMLVRKFLASCFQLLSDSNWNSQYIDKMLEVLSHYAISTEKVDAGAGLQLHVADIYIEELSKVTADEVSGKNLTKFFIPYCNVLIKTATPALRKTVIDRVFKFAIRLSDDEDDKNDGDQPTEEGETVNGNSVESEEEDDNDSVYSGEDLTITNSVHREWRHRIIKHEIESQKLPFPKFDYQNIGDILLEMAGKATSLNLKNRTEIYEVVKNFHEMAGGVFPLDTVAHTKGARLKKREIETAAKRLLEEENEYAQETLDWKQSRRHLSKKGKRGDGSDDDSDSVDRDSSSYESEDDVRDTDLVGDAESDKSCDEDFQADDDEIVNKESDAPVVVDKLLQRLLSRRGNLIDKKKEKRRRTKKTQLNQSLDSDLPELGNVRVNVINMQPDSEDKGNKEPENIGLEESLAFAQKKSSKAARKKLKKLKATISSNNTTDKPGVKEVSNSDVCEPINVHLSKEDNLDNSSGDILVKDCSVVISSHDSPKKIRSNNISSNVGIRETDTKLINGNNSENGDTLTQEALVKECSVVILSPKKMTCNNLASNVGGIQEADAKINGNKELNSTRKRLKYQDGKNNKKAKKNVDGSRYFNMSLNMDNDFTMSAKQVIKQSTPKVLKTEQFASFDKFIEKPPVFFKTAVSKVTPKTKKSVLNRSSVQNKSEQSGSPKKVFFKLDKNVAHEHNEYAKSVKSSPAIPFNSDVIPSQSALKLTSKAPQNFLSLNVNLKKRAVAKDFFVFD